MDFIKKFTPDFVLDLFGMLGGIVTFFSKLMSFENPFKKPDKPTTTTPKSRDEIDNEVGAVSGLGGFNFDLSEDPWALDEDEFWSRVSGVCEEDESITWNAKKMVDKYNMPISVAKKYAECFEAKSR